MPFLYNVHTPSKTFALSHKEGEDFGSLVSRIGAKSGLSAEDVKTVQAGKDGSGLVYEYEGGRWSLEDDDDLHILFERLPPSSTPSVTLHITPPHPHARFAPAPPSYTAASALKEKTKSPSKVKSATKAKSAASVAGNKDKDNESLPNGDADVKEKAAKTDGESKGENEKGEKQGKAKKQYGSIGVAGTKGQELGAVSGEAGAAGKDGSGTEGKGDKPAAATASASVSGGTKPKAKSHVSGLAIAPRSISTSTTISSSAAGHHFPPGTHGGHARGASAARESGALAPPVKGEKAHVVAHTEGREPGTIGRRWLTPTGGGGAPSVISTKSRRSKYGDDDAEPLGEVKKRAWHEFHNSTGVRTVVGQVGDIKNVRMLLKPGYKGVYISRSFALKHGLVHDKYSMGSSGYTGLKSIGLVAITVAGKTAKHNAMVNEEMHFDVVLGRTWLEKMNIKVDPIDQTILTYMDNGEAIPCDIVVLKDEQGNKIHIT